MRPLTIGLIVFLLLGIAFVFVTELYNQNKVQQSEIDGLRKQNQVERDSLEAILKVTQDSLEISYATIRQANLARLKAEEKSRQERSRFEAVVFVRYASDSARLNAIRNLYKTFNPVNYGNH